MNCRNTSTPSLRRTWSHLKAGLLGTAMMLFGAVSGQINYTQDFTSCAASTCNGWSTTGGYAASITSATGENYSPCSAGNPAAKSNIYSASLTNTLVTTTSLGVSSGELATFGFNYKLVNYLDGGTSPAGVASMEVSYGASASGPWTSITTFNNAEHGTCTAAPGISFTPSPGQQIHMRIVTTALAGVDINGYWIVIDDIELTQAAAPACTGAPDPGNTQSTTASACSGASFTLSLSSPPAGDGISIQWQSADDEFFTTNVVSMGTASTEITSQTAAHWYRAMVTCSAFPLSPTYSAPVYVGLSPVTECYCTPVTTFGCTDGDVIARVILNTLDNNSGTGCPSGALGYSNYTNDPLLTTELQAGGSYNCTVYAGQWAEGYAAWVDYNDDGVFGTNERIGYSIGTVPGSGVVGQLGGSATFPIALACDPPLGTHRLRVRAMYNTVGSAVTPCGDNFYGEVEDYLITITTADPCPQPSSLAVSGITTTGATLTWMMGCAETIWDVQVQLASEDEPTTASDPGLTSTTLVVSDLLPGTAYEFYVRADCELNGSSDWTGPFAFNTTPANDLCGDATVQSLAAGGSVTFTGNNAGSTDTEGLGFAQTWEAFTLSSCVSTLDVTYCGNAPAQGNVFVRLYLGCPSTTFLQGTSWDQTTCTDGNWTVHFNNVPAGTYYYPVLADGTSTGPYTINVNAGTACPVNTDCNAAIEITSVPVTGQAIACGTTNILSATTVPIACGGASNDYKGGNEALYRFVAPTTDNYKVSISGQSWSSIFVYGGACPSDGGTCMGSVGSSDVSKSLTVSLVSGQTYYIWFDTWPTPNSPCPGTFSLEVAPPPPANDEPCAATPVTVTSGCVFSSYTNLNATGSAGVPAPGCASYVGGDVWYSFVVPAGGTVTADMNTAPGGFTDLGMAWYTGTCSGLTLLECDDDDSDNGAMSKITRTGMTPGTTVWIRIWTYNNAAGGPFQMCVSIPPPPPANDDCINATSVLTNAGLTCANSASGTITSATASAEVAACGGTADDDVWFSFVATATSHNINIGSIVGNTDLFHALYSGSCGSLTLVPGSCSDPNVSNPTGLTIGQTYYLRVYTWTSTAGQSSSFNVCIGTIPAPGAECDGATSIGAVPVNNQSIACGGNALTGTNVPTVCGAAGTAYLGGNEAIYSFVAPTTDNYVVEIAGQSWTGIFVYSGACPTNGGTCVNSIGSSATSKRLIVPMTAGTTYYIIFDTWPSPDSPCPGTFSLFVAPPPPANEDCANAQSLTVYEEGACVATAGTTAWAPSEPPTGSCMNPDFVPHPSAVHYSFVATGYANIVTIDVDPTMVDQFNFVVRDACDGAEVGCFFPGSGDDNLIAGLTEGETYYIQVNSWVEGPFEICVTESPVQPPANDECATASELTVSPFEACVPYLDNNAAGTSSGANPSCLNPAVTILDLWYTFEATATTLTFNLVHEGSDGYGVTLYDACGGTEMSCFFVDAFSSGIDNALGGLTVGNTYVLRIGSMAASAGDIEICLTEPAPPIELTCGDAYIDAGGPGGDTTPDGSSDPGDYLNSSNEVTVICPDTPGDMVIVTFSAFSTESGYDPLYVFNGNGTDPATLIDGGAGVPNTANPFYNVYGNAGAGGWWGTTAPNNAAPNVVRASNATGCLTFAFTSDPSWTGLGWEAAVTCYTPNNTCATAAEVSCGGSYSGFTTDIAHDLPANSCAFNGDPSTGGQNYWLYTATSDTLVNVSTCGTADFDTRIAVYSGADCSSLSCVGLGDDTPGCTGGSSVSFNAIAGNSYYIVVMGVGAAEGNYDLSVNCAPLCTPEDDNDACAGALPLVVSDLGTGTLVDQTMACATVDAPTSCSGPIPVEGLWYTFTTGASPYVTLTLVDFFENSAYTNPLLNYAIHQGACTTIGAADEVVCAVDAGGVHDLVLQANTTYRMLVHNDGGFGLDGTFALKVEAPVAYDAEVSIITPAAGVVCSSNQDPLVEITNNGGATLTSLTFTYDIDGGTPSTFNWTGSLPYQQSLQVQLPTIAGTSGEHTLHVSVSQPNGQPDMVTSNDAAQVTYNASGEAVKVVINVDASGDGVTWAIYNANFQAVATGSAAGQGNTMLSTTACLPMDPLAGPCFSFFLFDSYGDGLCCANGNGYWELRTPANAVLLRDRFDDADNGSQSPSTTPLTSVYNNGHSICLPAGPSIITSGDCGVFSNNLQSRVDATPVPGVTNYQFEFSDPDAGFMRRIILPRPWVRFSEMVTSPLLPGKTYFARVKVDQGLTGMGDDHFGTGCEMGIDPNQVQGCTGLIDNISLPTHSCGVTRSFGGSAKIWARPVTGATQYRFRFTNANEGFTRTIARPSYVCALNWVSSPLVNGATYQVSVETLVSGQWSGYCGPICDLTIMNPANMPAQRIDQVDNATDVQLWPNPTGDGRVNILVNGIADQQQRISVEVMDMTGRKVLAEQFGNSGTVFNTVLQLPEGIASGVYLVNITINDQLQTQRLSVR